MSLSDNYENDNYGVCGECLIVVKIPDPKALMPDGWVKDCCLRCPDCGPCNSCLEGCAGVSVNGVYHKKCAISCRCCTNISAVNKFCFKEGTKLVKADLSISQILEYIANLKIAQEG